MTNFGIMKLAKVVFTASSGSRHNLSIFEPKMASALHVHSFVLNITTVFVAPWTYSCDI